MLPTLRDPAQQRRYERDGFALVSVASGAHADELRGQIERVLPATLPSFFSPHRGDTEALREMLHETIISSLGEQVIGLLQNQRVFWASALVKQPGGENALELHQDWTFVDDQRASSGLVWVALNDCDEHNGGMVVIPGSHRWGPPRRGSLPWPNSLDGRRRADLARRAVAVNVPKGHALVYDHGLIHGSTANCGIEARFAAALAFAPSGYSLVHCTRDDDGRFLQFPVADSYFNHQRVGELPSAPWLLGGALEVDPGRLTVTVPRERRTDRALRGGVVRMGRR